MRHGILSSLFGLTLLVAGPASAQSPGPDPDAQKKLVLASELVEVLNLQPMMNQVPPVTARNIVAAIQQQTKKPVPESTQKTISDVVRRKMAERLPDIIYVLAPVTAEALSADEMQALVTFYKSPQGQSILNKLPGYMAQSQRLLASWGQQNIPAVEKAIVEELKSKGVDVPPPPQQQSQQQQQQQPQQPK
ncbi:MAG: DUF2059 domain-containing protein [Pseudomonadota bacterium]|nr:DUF2059 domain-containing protein [Pseudomonadota bacterium]